MNDDYVCLFSYPYIYIYICLHDEMILSSALIVFWSNCGVHLLTQIIYLCSISYCSSVS